MEQNNEIYESITENNKDSRIEKMDVNNTTIGSNELKTIKNLNEIKDLKDIKDDNITYNKKIDKKPKNYISNEKLRNQMAITLNKPSSQKKIIMKPKNKRQKNHVHITIDDDISETISMGSIEDLSIFSYFEGKNILLTGSTDFVGKCFLEKLLRVYVQYHLSEYKDFKSNLDQETTHDSTLNKKSNKSTINIESSKDKLNKTVELVQIDYLNELNEIDEDLELKNEKTFSFKKIFLLLNSSHPQKPTLRELFNSPIFDTLKSVFNQEEWNYFVQDKVHILESTFDENFVRNHFSHGSINWETVSLKLSKNDDSILRDNINIVVHSECRHSIIHSDISHKDPEFTSLRESFKINVLGTMMLLNYCKKMKNLSSFCYLSSSFVNCDQKGGSYIREEIYPLKLPKNCTLESLTESICFSKQIANRTDQNQNASLIEGNQIKKIKALMKQLNFPNSYTFSKRIAEHMIQKYRGSIPVAIVRPSIIGAAEREPIRGWIDPQTIQSQSFNSASIYLRIGLGLLRVIPGKPENHADQIPVDFVVNTLLLASTAIGNRDKIQIFQIGTSSGKNPCTWAETIRGVLSYWQSYSQKNISSNRPEFQMVSKRNWYHATKFLSKPNWINQSMDYLTKTVTKPFEGLMKVPTNHVGHIVQEIQLQTSHINQSNNTGVSLSLSFINNESFHYFTLNEWCFEILNTIEIHDKLNEEEQSIFFLDIEKIDWHSYFQYFCYGIAKFCLMENVEPPVFCDLLTREGEHSIIPLSAATSLIPKFMVNDLSFVYYANSFFNSTKTKSQFITSVLNSKQVQKAIRQEMAKMSCTRSQAQAKAITIMDRMFADPQMKYVRTFSYILRKVWRVMFNAIYIDTDEMAMIRKISSDPDRGSLILLPTHRSYLDFLIISFVCFAYDLPIPHIAAGEDFLGMLGVRTLFRHSGAFFLRRSFQDDVLYKTIFQEYVQQLLADGAPLEFFVEGTRSRGGKTIQPKLGLLSIICDAYFSRRVDNLTIIPINISYEKVLEREAYSHELLGQQKTPETLGNLLKNIYSILSKSYGSIAVSFSQPIRLTNFVDEISLLVEDQNEKNQIKQHIDIQDKIKTNLKINDISKDMKYNFKENNSKIRFSPHTNVTHRKILVKNLATKIAYKLDENAVIMPTSLASTIILQYRNGISLTRMIEKMSWLKQQIILRGGRIYWTPNELTTSVLDRCLALMKNEIYKKDNILKPAVRQRNHMDYAKHIQLHCYRNQLIHLFSKEALVACAIGAFFALESHQKEFSQPIFNNNTSQQNNHNSHKNNNSNTKNYFSKEEASSSLTQFYHDKSVSIQDVLKQCTFLYDLIGIEFIFSPDDNSVDFPSTINTMIKRDILQLETSASSISSSQSLISDFTTDWMYQRIKISNFETFNFLQHLLWPFIDTYWVSVQCILSLYSHHLQSQMQLEQHFQNNSQHNFTIDTSNQKTVTNTTLPSSGAYFDRNLLHDRIQWLTEKCFFNGQLLFYESCCSDIIKNAISVLLNLKILEKGKQHDTLTLSKEFCSFNKLSEFSNQIYNFRKISKEKKNHAFTFSKL